MRKETNEWSVRMLADLKSRINVDAEFQRGSVWTRPQQALLIDSILRGFDIPKIYLSKLPDGSLHLFDVIDGKQRLMAIWSFLDDEIPLGRTAGPFNGLGELGGKRWSQLPDHAKDRLQFASMTVSKLENASEEEIRELFLRLQKGETLRAAEKRNAVAGPVRDFVAETLACHSFWPKTKIRELRHGWHEHAAIVLALARTGGPTALKAADLRDLYEVGDFDPNGETAHMATRLLDVLEKVADEGDGLIIQTRWAIVDLCVVLMMFWNEGQTVVPGCVAQFLRDFEVERKRVGREVRDLQTEVVEISTEDIDRDATIYLPEVPRDILQYYLAFSREGATHENVARRSTVMYDRLVAFLGSDTGNV